MDLLKRPVGTICYTQSKLDPLLVTMPGNSGQWNCGISYWTCSKGLAGWGYEDHFVFLLFSPVPFQPMNVLPAQG